MGYLYIIYIVTSRVKLMFYIDSEMSWQDNMAFENKQVGKAHSASVLDYPFLNVF